MVASRACVQVVRYRLGKYVTQPDHPHRVGSEDAHAIFRKILREVVEKEQQAYEGRRTQGLFKLIEKRKVKGGRVDLCLLWRGMGGSQGRSPAPTSGGLGAS